MGGIPYWILPVALVLVVFTVPGFCLRESYVLSESTQAIIQATSFGFTNDGFANFSVVATPPHNIKIMGCTRGQVEEFQRVFGTPDQLCIGFDELACTMKESGQYGAAVISQNVHIGDIYYFYIINCDFQGADYLIETAFLNSNGNELPTGQLPLPFVFIGIAVATSVVLVAFGVRWIQNRDVRIFLHLVMVVYLFVKIIWAVFAFVYWITLNQTGVELLGVTIGYRLVMGIYWAVFFTLLSLCSMGLNITTTHLGKQWFIAISCGLVAGVALAVAAQLRGFVMLLTYILYVGEVMMLLYFSNRNHKLLRRFAEEIAPEPDSFEAKQLKDKLRFYSVFKMACCAFILATMTMILLDIVLLEAVRWAGLLIRQSLDLLLFCYIGWQMRMQENSTMYSMLPEFDSFSMSTTTTKPR